MALTWHTLNPVGSKLGSAWSPGAERGRPGAPVLHGLRPRKIEHLAGARSRVAPVGKTGEYAGAFVHEG